MSACSKSDSEYSSLRSRNSRTNGSLMASSGVIVSPGSARLSLLEHGGFVLRERDALVELAADLTVELPDGPARTEGFSLVESSALPGS